MISTPCKDVVHLFRANAVLDTKPFGLRVSDARMCCTRRQAHHVVCFSETTNLRIEDHPHHLYQVYNRPCSRKGLAWRGSKGLCGGVGSLLVMSVLSGCPSPSQAPAKPLAPTPAPTPVTPMERAAPTPSCEELAATVHHYDGQVSWYIDGTRQLTHYVACFPETSNLRIEGHAQGFAALESLTGLERLVLEMYSGYTKESGLDTLPRLPRLRSVSIRCSAYHAGFPQAPSKWLARYPALEDVSILVGAGRARFWLTQHSILAEGHGSVWQPWLDAGIERYPEMSSIQLRSTLDLGRLGSVRKLQALQGDVRSIGTAPALPQLHALEVQGGREPFDLDLLARFPNLEHLTLRVQTTGGTRPLALSNLTGLLLQNGDQDTLARFAASPLTHLVVQHGLHSADPVRLFPSLRLLELWDTIATTRPLIDLSALQIVDLHSAGDLALLERAPKLVSLKVGLTPAKGKKVVVPRNIHAPELHLVVVRGQVQTGWLRRLRKLSHLDVEVGAKADLRPIAARRELDFLKIQAPSDIPASASPSLVPLRNVRIRKLELHGCFRGISAIVGSAESESLPSDSMSLEELAKLRNNRSGGYGLNGRACHSLQLAR